MRRFIVDARTTSETDPSRPDCGTNCRPSHSGQVFVPQFVGGAIGIPTPQRINSDSGPRRRRGRPPPTHSDSSAGVPVMSPITPHGATEMTRRRQRPSRKETVNLIDDFARVSRPIIREHFGAASCVASTRIAIEAFSAFGLPAEPLVARIFIDNAILCRLQETNPNPSAADFRQWEDRGAYGVEVGKLCDFGRCANGWWNGHLVAMVGGTHIVDASADQVNQPAKGIVLPGVLVLPLPGPLPSQQSLIQTIAPDGTRIAYEFHPHNRSFRQTQSWHLSAVAGEVAQTIIGAMDARRFAREAA